MFDLMPELTAVLAAGLLLLLGAVLGGVGRRFNGGLLGQWVGQPLGSFPGRTAFAAMLTIPLQLGGMPFGHALAFAGLTWIGCAMGMWSGLGMGRVGDMRAPPVSLRAWSIAAACMTAHGVGAVALSAAYLWWAGWSPWPVLIAGLLCAPVYELAFRAPFQDPLWGCYRSDPPPTAELIWGGLRGVAGVATILIGRVG